MSFNKSFNLTAAINDMMFKQRKHVLLALVGSCNAMIFGAADRIAVSLARDGYDYRELERRDIVSLTSGVDATDGGLSQTRKLYALANEWRTMLRACSQDESNKMEHERIGSMAGTIEMMCGKQKMRATQAGAAELLATVGVTVTPAMAEAVAKQRLLRDQHFADDRNVRKGFIEFIIDNLFEYEDHEDTEWFTQLDTDTRERLCNKFLESLGKGIDQATQNVLLGARGDVLGLGDIPILQALLARHTQDVYPIEAIKVAMADTPSPKAKRVRKVKEAA